MAIEQDVGEQLAIAELRSIVTLAQEGAPKGELISRLYTVSLTGSLEETVALRMLGAVKGWSGEVKEYQKTQKPANKAPHLRVVEPGFLPPEKQPADGLPDGWENPRGYTCYNSGVYHFDEVKGDVRICARPIWIGARWADVDAGDHLVEVHWHGGSSVIKRSTALNSREIIVLADKGAPVSSVNSRAVVQWLQASEEVNSDIIPLHTSISRVGWTKHDGKQRLQGPDGPHLLRAEEGHQQTVRAMAPRGSLAAWLRAAKVVNQHPVAALMLAASVASVLLEPMGAAPFALDLHGHSTRGKTLAARWAASAWGDPDDSSAFILPWSASPAAIEGRAGYLCNLPVILDDTKKIPLKDRDKMLAIVMGWGSGQGKARGMPGGVQTVATWCSVLISTGEAPLSRLGGENVGMRLRILPVSDQPFPDGAEAVRIIESLDAHGVIGPGIEVWAAKNWDRLPGLWQTARNDAEEALAKGPSGGRLSGYIASIRIAMDALESIGVEMPRAAVVDLLRRGAETALASADTSTEAWESIGAWLVANGARISEQVGNKDDIAPAGGWLGRARPDGSVAVSPPALDAELRRIGYDPCEIVPLWMKAGRLANEAGRSTVIVRWLGKNTRMYLLQGLDGWGGKLE